jgi:energy-coupling factor transporter ATP-binding protein EcfA2
MRDTVLKRMRKLDIENFRGFVGHHALDTDADIVLLAGPNGFGKSSLLQALQLLLTGHYEAKDSKGIRSVAAQRGKSETVDGVGDPRIQVRAKASFQPQITDDDLSLVWTAETNEPTFAPNDCPRMIRVAGLGERAGHDKRFQRRLLARITTFYPEQVDDLFKTVTTGATLRDIYQPRPTQVRAAREEFVEQKKQMEALLNRVQAKMRPPEQLEDERNKTQRELNERWQPIRDAIQVLARHAERERDTLVGLSDLRSPTPGQLSDLLRDLRGGLPTEAAAAGAQLISELQQLARGEIESAQKRAEHIAAPKELRHRKQEVEDELEAIAHRHPGLDEFLACFASLPQNAILPHLLFVLKTLAEHSHQWVENADRLPETERRALEGVLTELRAVVPDNASKCARELEQWLEPLQRADERRRLLIEELKDVDRQLEAHRQSLELDALEAADKTLRDRDRSRSFEAAYHARRKLDLLAEGQDKIKGLETRLEGALKEIDTANQLIENATGPSRAIHDAVKEFANKVLLRFALVEGVLPLELREIPEPLDGHKRSDEDRHTEITTHSGLNLEHLSTGQRAQVAVALAVAQSQLLRKELPYHILLLDDVSTAYDLSNLTREAVLWRQLAYRDKPEDRWQLFIASHHEDLTNHLLDLLIPPSGRSLRLLNFKGWSPETGPDIESFSVESSENVSAESGTELRESLASAMKEELCRTF